MTDPPPQTRNSTAEFLIFTAQAGEQGIEVRFEEETVWLTQKVMAELFEISVPTINEHLRVRRVGQGFSCSEIPNNCRRRQTLQDPDQQPGRIIPAYDQVQSTRSPRFRN